MLTLDAMRRLRDAYGPYGPGSEAEVLDQIGNPTREEIIETAIDALGSDDRNLRVLGLRVLKGQSGKRAEQGILMGLVDPKRRVREVAIKSSAAYQGSREIARRLSEMASDEAETNRIRSFALGALVSTASRAENETGAGAIESLAAFCRIDAYRPHLLAGLLQLDLNGRVEELLREFVSHGTREEAVMATRALCGYRVANIGLFEAYPEVKRYVAARCELASGRVWYWIPRRHYDFLLEGRIPD